MKTIPIVIIIILITGCGLGGQYYHDTKDEQQFNRDRYECRLVAEQGAANWGNKGNPFSIASRINECMEMRYGWKRK